MKDFSNILWEFIDWYENLLLINFGKINKKYKEETISKLKD